MKQTAVEWLVEKMTQQDFIAIPKPEWIEQAKEIEKQQSIKFGKIVADKWGMISIPLENIENIYNETFKSE